MDHLDIGHHVFNLMLRGKLYLAPIPSNLQVSNMAEALGIDQSSCV